MLFLTTSVLFPALVTCFLLYRSWASTREMSKIPGTTGWPIVGETFSFLSEFSSPSGIYSFISKRQKRYGKVFKTSALGRLTVFLTGREASKILLSGKDGTGSLNLSYAGQQVLGPTSLLTTNGEEHKRLRRLIGNPLSVDALKSYFSFISDLAVETLEGWNGREVFVLQEASMFTLKVIGNMIMSLEPRGEEQEKFRANFKKISTTFQSLPLKIPGFAFHRGLKARDEMYSMLDSIISRRRAGKDIQQDFLQTLLSKHSNEAEQQEDPDKLSDSQMKDNILTLLIAGHDTTTAGLTWLIKFVGENPNVWEKLREEHIAIRERRSDGGLKLSWAEVNSMPYTNKVISESLRKATILPWFSRKVANDFDMEGYKIKKGWAVHLDVVSIHHDPNIFPDPEKFDPSRFDIPLKNYSFLGFGSGPRMCPGMNLAKLEICIFVHYLICKYKWRPLDRDDSVHGTLVRMPKNNYPIIVEPLY